MLWRLAGHTDGVALHVKETLDKLLLRAAFRQNPINWCDATVILVFG